MLFYQRKNPWRPFIFWQKKAASSTTIVIMIFRMTIQNRWFSETVFSSWPVVSKNIEDKFDQPNHYTELKAKFYIQSVALRKALYEWFLYLYLLFSISSGVIHKFFFLDFSSHKWCCVVTRWFIHHIYWELWVYLIGQNFVRQNFRLANFFVQKNLRHLEKVFLYIYATKV